MDISVTIINLVVRHLNLYVGKERIHFLGCHACKCNCHGGQGQPGSKITVLSLSSDEPHVIFRLQLETEVFERVWAQYRDILVNSSSQAITESQMGRKKYNLCNKCGFRHAAPTGKACTAGDGVRSLEKHDRTGP